MKFLVVIAILVVGYMVWRSARVGAGNRPSANAQRPADGKPQDMVECPVCAVHLPRGDAVAGADGRLFCSQEHRLKSGGA